MNNHKINPDLAVKQLDLNEKKFMANGKTYYIENKLSIIRFCEFQIYEKEVAFNMTFDKLYQNLKDNCDYVQNIPLNEFSFKDIAQIITNTDNVLKGVQVLAGKEPFVLKLCALFINEEHEDRKAWSEDIMHEKIKDWKIEGYDMDGFFQIALSSINNYIGRYNSMHQTISSMEEEGAK